MNHLTQSIKHVVIFRLGAPLDMSLHYYFHLRTYVKSFALDISRLLAIKRARLS